MFGAFIDVNMPINWNHYAIPLFVRYWWKHIHLPTGTINTAKKLIGCSGACSHEVNAIRRIANLRFDRLISWQ
jgi:hypothetical protein